MPRSAAHSLDGPSTPHRGPSDLSVLLVRHLESPKSFPHKTVVRREHQSAMLCVDWTACHLEPAKPPGTTVGSMPWWMSSGPNRVMRLPRGAVVVLWSSKPPRAPEFQNPSEPTRATTTDPADLPSELATVSTPCLSSVSGLSLNHNHSARKACRPPNAANA